MKKILVIGGGIGGLCTAAVLQKRGWNVKLFEAAPSIKAAGAGLGVGSNALKALYEAGIGKEIEEQGNPLWNMVFLNDKGKQLNEMDFTDLSNKFGLDSLTIHRAALHRILYGALKPGTVQLNKRCIDFKMNTHGITAIFDDGSTEKGVLLVAADGIHSAIRKKLVAQSHPRYAGYTCWRGVVKFDHPAIDNHTSYEIWGREGRFGIVPLQDSQVYWFACINAAKNDPVYKRLLPKDVANIFQAFPVHVQQIILATQKDELLHHDIMDLRPLRKFSYGRVVLLGDAGHATTPNMGQGAGQAIEDAIVLANSLETTNSLEDALKRYETKRVKRTRQIIRMSRRIGAVAQWEQAYAAAIRDSLFQLVPSKLLLRAFRFILDVDF